MTPTQAFDLPGLEHAVDTFNGFLEGADILLGHPPSSQARWFRFEQIAEEDVGRQIIERIVQQARAEGQAGATYTLRYLLYGPLALTGYLFACHGWIPRFSGTLIVSDTDWLNHAHWVTPVLSYAVSEPSTNQNDPADLLFAELQALVGPLIDSWVNLHWIARANAWACAIDSLAYGFQLAGKSALGPDLAWEKWESAVAGRIFPVRRRPRRFLFDIDGQSDELLIRSGCCLWFTQTAAQASSNRYCVTCYLQSDAQRLDQLIALRRRQTSHA